MSDAGFHLAADCPQCGNQLVEDGISITLVEHERTGLPVISVEMCAMADFRCRDCRVLVSYAGADPYVEDLDDEDGDSDE